MPAALAADSGFDALTHATEAYVSVYANDFTDGMALHAIRLIFDNLDDSVTGTPGAIDTVTAREKMHNAGTIAGMAFGNAFLGIVHAMAHTIGGTFHLVHGRTNATLLPHVIRYNGSGSDQAEQLAEVRALRRTGAVPADRGDARAAGGHRGGGRGVLRRWPWRSSAPAVGIPPSFAAQGVDEHGLHRRGWTNWRWARTATSAPRPTRGCRCWPT